MNNLLSGLSGSRYLSNSICQVLFGCLCLYCCIEYSGMARAGWWCVPCAWRKKCVVDSERSLSVFAELCVWVISRQISATRPIDVVRRRRNNQKQKTHRPLCWCAAPAVAFSLLYAIFFRVCTPFGSFAMRPIFLSALRPLSLINAQRLRAAQHRLRSALLLVNCAAGGARRTITRLGVRFTCRRWIFFLMMFTDLFQAIFLAVYCCL